MGKQGREVGKTQGRLWRELSAQEQDMYNVRAKEIRKMKPRGLTTKGVEMRNQKILSDIESAVKRAGECI